MNSQQKTALANSRTFLSKNIVWTPEFASRLVEDGLVTQYILTDVQKQESREAQTQALLDVLPLKGGQTFDKFCDLLHLTGHYFLADFLRDEANRNEDTGAKDLYKRLTFLEKLRDFEKKKLESYISNKVKEELVKNSWKTELSEKDKTFAVREKQIHQHLKHEEDSKQNQITIADLQQRLKESSEEVSMLKIQSTALKQSMLELEAKHKEQLNRQIRFNLANDSSLRRVQERIEEQESTLEEVRRKVHSALGLSRKPTEPDDIGIPEPELTSLLGDLEKVIDKVRHLGDVERKYESLLEERDWIIMHLGADSNATSLVQAYKKFAVQNDENLHSLKQEVVKYSDLVKEQENKGEEARTQQKTKSAASVWQSALMSVMKRQLQDLKTGAKQKDKKIEGLENEVNSLKSKLAAAEKGAVAQEAFLDLTDNRLQGLGNPTQNTQKLEVGRSYKNSFLPPLRNSTSPVEAPVMSNRKSKPVPGMSSMNRGFNPRAHHFTDSVSGNSYRLDAKVRYGQPYHTLSQGLSTTNGQSKADFQLGEKIIIGKRIQ